MTARYRQLRYVGSRAICCESPEWLHHTYRVHHGIADRAPATVRGGSPRHTRAVGGLARTSPGVPSIRWDSPRRGGQGAVPDVRGEASEGFLSALPPGLLGRAAPPRSEGQYVYIARLIWKPDQASQMMRSTMLPSITTFAVVKTTRIERTPAMTPNQPEALLSAPVAGPPSQRSRRQPR